MKERFDQLSATCSKSTTKLYSTSFSLGILFLSKDIRPAIYAIYGFVRLADEIVDSFHDFDKASLLSEFKTDCFNAIIRGISLNPVLNSFQQAVKKYGIDHALINQFLKSMEMDLGQKNYTTDAYDEYILGSAQVVGLMCLQVFSNGNRETYARLKPSAMKLGSAFQKVNFLRDLHADYNQLNRSYFPGVDLERFSDQQKKMIEVEIHQEFEEARQGIRQLPYSSRKGVYLAYVYYQKLFRKLSNHPAEKIMSERVRISNRYKCWLMFNSLIKYKLNAI